MERSKLVAIITGAISILLAIAYLLLVQFLDFRGEMIPAPVSQLPQGVEVVEGYVIQVFPLLR
ncbi:MAG: glucose-inhibited division protein A [Microcoleus sp. SIO2G3]|nr:glucose-inhibited division protein A [Microcoleus sp. SIO2G3]